MAKNKILFVVEDFYRAGAERFAYEINRALDKNIFEVEILCLAKKKEVSSLWGERYYEAKHRELGSKIIYIDRFFKNNNTTNKLIKKIQSKFSKRPYSVYKSNLFDYLTKFDVIHWMGEYTFIHSVPENITRKSLIHSMSAKFQNPDIYKHFDFEYPYNFISGFFEEDGEYSQFKKINHWFLPLVMQIPFKNNNWNFTNNKIKKIGIFTRLSKYKPLDPFFYSFQLLLEKFPNCELHIFGNGDPVREGMIRYLETLNIKNKVFFRGHQEDIIKTALKEQIDLSWFQGFNNERPAGYAGFDICLSGTPLICWDFIEIQTKPFNEIYPHYKNLVKFVEKSFEVLTSEEKAKNLSQLQFDDVIDNRDIDKKIAVVVSAYQQIMESNLS